jgi:multidrug resistance efflux pump
VLEVQRREDRWLPAKALEALRTQLDHLVGPRHVGLKLGVVATSLVLFFLAVAKGDYRVTADAVLEPAVVRASVTPFDGYVAAAPARAGDVVKQGDLLAELDDRDIGLERLRWVSEAAQYEQQYRQALAVRDAAEAEIAAASLAEARAELARADDRLARTEIRAPFDGVVVTGDLSQQLGAPVEKGSTLFEVAPLDAYRLILQVDERDVAEVRVGQTGRLVLSSLPDDPLDFEVVKLTPVSTAEEGVNFFRVEAGIDLEDGRLRPAIEGVGKIEVGRRRLIWIWTHDAIDWLRLQLWAWLP